MVRIINCFTILLAAAATMVSSAPTTTPENTLKRVGRSAAADGPDSSTAKDDRFIAEAKEFAETEMKEAEEAYKLAKALYKQRIDAAENGGQIQFTQFSEVS
ncbi:hypothetical protein NCS57_00839000 [Fusarium keratoplasticum]|uniref:Uncharacterized protein n=1 Tax=Fusarium keratoplasticum TaxID=1328300 RepID=A0ACC0QVN3_9HYPO|nr:hypothetical protein NCS57_00839000 [Fusarium keratoplasticum]KAI8666150.1 hypothetical protein NCS57_00839000 [Fusarium keratoplasticum]